MELRNDKRHPMRQHAGEERHIAWQSINSRNRQQNPSVMHQREVHLVAKQWRMCLNAGAACSEHTPITIDNPSPPIWVILSA